MFSTQCENKIRDRESRLEHDRKSCFSNPPDYVTLSWCALPICGIQHPVSALTAAYARTRTRCSICGSCVRCRRCRGRSAFWPIRVWRVPEAWAGRKNIFLIISFLSGWIHSGLLGYGTRDRAGGMERTDQDTRSSLLSVWSHWPQSFNCGF